MVCGGHGACGKKGSFVRNSVAPEGRAVRLFVESVQIMQFSCWTGRPDRYMECRGPNGERYKASGNHRATLFLLYTAGRRRAGSAEA